MRGRMIAGVAVVLAGLWSPTAAAETGTSVKTPQRVVLADFNDPAQNAALRTTSGGAFQTWSVTGECVCTQRFIEDDASGRVGGHALQLSYSVSCPPHFNGWFMFLSSEERAGLDVSAYDRLGFSVKGNTTFVVEVKDHTSRDDGSAQGVAQYTVTGVGSQWRWVEIPFSAFVPKQAQTIDWSGIRQLVIVFSDVKSNLAGDIALDDVSVLHGSAGPSR